MIKNFYVTVHPATPTYGIRKVSITLIKFMRTALVLYCIPWIIGMESTKFATNLYYSRV